MPGMLLQKMPPRAKNISHKLLFLDLDGTVRKGFDELGRFVNHVEDVALYPGVADLLQDYVLRGWAIMGVSNQGGVAMGHLTTKDVIECLGATNVLCNRAFDGFVWCEHHPDSEDPVKSFCMCRKPKYGMLVIAQQMIHQLYMGAEFPLHMALMVGDRPEDEECARGAGVNFRNAADWRAEALRLNVGVPLPPLDPNVRRRN